MPVVARSLRSVPIFADLDDRTIERIATVATEIEAKPGQVLIQLNDPGSGMYVVQEGSVAVELRGRSVELGPGEFFGELSLLLGDARRSARVRAQTPARCLALPRELMEELLASEPTLTLAMLRALAARLLDEIAGR